MKAAVKTTLCAIALITTSVAGAAVYKYVDENGKVAYSDKPIEGSEQVKIHGVKSSSSSSDSSSNSRDSNSGSQRGGEEEGDEGESATNYSSLMVLTPRDGKVVDPASGTVQIIMLPTPTLGENDELVISIDGKDVNKGREVNLSVQNLPNGDHTVAGRIETKDGDVVIESPAVSFQIGE